MIQPTIIKATVSVLHCHFRPSTHPHTKMQKASNACMLAALVCHDSNVEVSAENLAAAAKAGGVDVKKNYAEVFASVLSKITLEDLLGNLAVGGGAAPAAAAPAAGGAAPAAAPAADAGAAAAPAAAAAKEPSEEDEDMGFGLFD
eukprot:Rhum_TRINITY_DN14760_c1_g2::Rhum_TRINITY_DN14760_c1_g2_i1::g.115816::m.115816/K02942/RP-LP1, RPLP1; large subunit ribosomal protein LP1